MVPARDLLARFRPAGAPGAATVAGVPADRPAAAAAELVPVFQALESPLAECRRIRDHAAAHSARLVARAEDRASALVARARAAAGADRAAAAAGLRASTTAEVNAIFDRAEWTAQAVRRRAARTSPALVDRVVELVRGELIRMSTVDAAADQILARRGRS